MTSLRDRSSRRVPASSSPNDGVATVAISLLLAMAVVMIVVVLIIASAVTAWLRAQPPHSSPAIYQLQQLERGR